MDFKALRSQIVRYGGMESLNKVTPVYEIVFHGLLARLRNDEVGALIQM